MKKLIYFLILLSFVSSVTGQTKISCAVGRYEKDVFAAVGKKTVPYASNKGWNGENINLEANIYEPTDDTAALRPLIIFAHGGGFVRGKKEDMAFFCNQFSKKGYVTASIQYRLIPLDKLTDISNMKREIVKAMRDFKAAIRYFRANAKTYKIDPNNIFIGGVSAGAITALHVGLLDENDQMPDDFAQFVANEGGLESVKVKGVINYSGSILEESWIDKSDAPVFSYHGTADEVVPIGYGVTGRSFKMFGSESIKNKADEVGLFSLLVKVPSGGHTNIYLDASYAGYYIDFHRQVNTKMRSMLCGRAKANK
jgi:predicted esterase